MLTRSGSEMREAARPTDEIGRRRLVSKSISLKLRIRAVVWKMGAHQPGGPPLRTTTAPPFRSSPPGMDAGRQDAWAFGVFRVTPNVLPTVWRRQALLNRRILKVTCVGGKLSPQLKAQKTNFKTQSCKQFLGGGGRYAGC